MNLPAAIDHLIQALRSEAPLGFEIDRPATPAGEWWLDLDVDGMQATVLWQDGRGFGLFTSDGEAGIGDRPTEIYSKPHEASRRLLQLSAKWKVSASRPPLELRDVRHLVGGTQTDLARSLGMDQAGVSRLEKRNDWKLSTLQEYVAAMGGVLELRVRFPSFEAPLAAGDVPREKGRPRSRHAS